MAEAYFDEILPSRPVLAVIGSISEKSIEQMDYAVRQKIEFIKVNMCDVLAGKSVDRYIDEAGKILNQGKDLIITAARSREK